MAENEKLKESEVILRKTNDEQRAECQNLQVANRRFKRSVSFWSTLFKKQNAEYQKENMQLKHSELVLRREKEEQGCSM